MDLSELIESIDIVDYISQFVKLEKRGEEYWGISPFTFPPEKTPSFSVRRENGSFYCFSSGIGGSVFSFIKHYNKCSATEAINIMKAYTGTDGIIDGIHNKLSATKICKKFMPTKKEHKKQNVSSYQSDCMEKYERDLDKLKVWESEGISLESLDKFQVRYDGFSNRLVYPIRDIKGNIVNIGGRTLDKDWKEKKMRKYTYLSSWGSMDVVYGLYDNMDAILKRKEVIVFEGCKSVLIADTWGIHNAVAILTSHLSEAQLKIFAKLGVRVVFALDKEIDITKDHNIKRLIKYVKVDWLHDDGNLTAEKDSPVDKGIDVFIGLYKNRKRIR